ncbi:MAG: hypothetical protein R2729_30890 [Bryobacteraceae bacterium]
MHRWLIVAAVAAAGVCAAQSEPSHPGIAPEVLRIARIKVRARENLEQLPNYTCTETIERSRRGAKSRRFRLTDTLRLEVALVGGKELYAWPGANKFDDRELRDMVGGTIGNGSFALHARSVFLSNVPTYKYIGEVEEFGRKLYRYSYYVPVNRSGYQLLNRSGYQLRVGDVSGVAGYHGEFDVDSQSLDLVRLEVIAHDIPPHVTLAAARDEMRYQRVAIGESDFLLPHSSELSLTGLDGEESRNRTSFANCHQYSGESTISFDDPPPTASAAPPGPVAEVELPEGLILETRLVEPLSLQTIAIGDIVEVEVTSNAKKAKATIVPRGARAHGRVLAYRREYNRSEMHILRLRLEEIEFPGARAEILAIPVGARIPQGNSTAVDKTGIIYLRGQRQSLMKGTPLIWRIEAKQPDTGRNTQ